MRVSVFRFRQWRRKKEEYYKLIRAGAQPKYAKSLVYGNGASDVVNEPGTVGSGVFGLEANFEAAGSDGAGADGAGSDGAGADGAGQNGAVSEAEEPDGAGSEAVEPEAPAPGTRAAVRYALRHTELRFLIGSTRRNILNALASNPGEILTDRTQAKILIALYSDGSRALNERGQELIRRARLATILAIGDDEGAPSIRVAIASDLNSVYPEPTPQVPVPLEQPRARTTDPKGNVAVRIEEADEEDVYATEDGRLEVSFLYHNTGNEGWRIYILSDLDYGGQDTGAHETHRYYSNELRLHFICYEPRIPTKAEAKLVSADWADLTSNYMLTGRQF